MESSSPSIFTISLIALTTIAAFSCSALTFYNAYQSHSNLEGEIRANFEEFISSEGRNYGGDELEARFAIYRDNAYKVKEFNAANLTSTVKLNKFSDLTDEEFERIYASTEPYTPEDEELIKAAQYAPYEIVPDNVDINWVSH
jgi:hypothetical protein